MAKPKTIDEYIEWANNEFGVAFNSPKIENTYNTNATSIFNEVSNSKFYNGLDAKIEEWCKEYNLTTSSDLLMSKNSLQLHRKPFKSIIDKSFRINVLWNNKYPAHPSKGWFKPTDIYTCVNDIVRSTYVCKFIDGPQFLCEKLTQYAEEIGVECKSYSQERDSGYYAYHFYIYDTVDILNFDWEKIPVKVSFEIQITTQLQEVLKQLTHQHYETSRLLPDSNDSSWKWDYSSNMFRASYMCHTLHLLEAIILDLRKKSDNLEYL